MRKLITLGIIMCLFLGISVFSVRLIMQPVVVHRTEYTMSGVYEGETTHADNALTLEGMFARGEAWKALPTYNIGLGIIAGIAFIGSGITCREMYLEYYKDKNER